jgi:hypothetical protein
VLFRSLQPFKKAFAFGIACHLSIRSHTKKNIFSLRYCALPMGLHLDSRRSLPSNVLVGGGNDIVVLSFRPEGEILCDIMISTAPE